MKIFAACYTKGSLIRSVCVAAYKLEDSSYRQVSLFNEENDSQEEEGRLDQTIEQIRSLYGKEAIIRASARLEASTALRRMEQIGGHRK